MNVDDRDQLRVEVETLRARVQELEAVCDDDATRQHDRRLRQFAESMDEAFWLVSADESELYYVSPGFERLTGLPCASLYEQPDSWLKVIHPDDRARIQREVVGSPGVHDDVRNHEVRVLRQDGSVVWVWLRSHPVYDQSGRQTCRAGVAIDISDRKRTEETLEERDRFFKHSLSLFCIADTDGFFRRLNPAWERVLGYREEEMLARPFIEFVHEDDRASTVAAIEQLRHGADVVRFENRYRCRDGTYRWLEWNCPAPQPGDTVLYATARDVTTRKEAVAALVENERRIRLMTDSMPVLIAYVDRDLRYQFTNGAYEDWFGLSREKVLGEAVHDLLGDDVYETLRPHARRALEGNSVRFDTMLPNRYGQSRYVHISFVPHRDADRSVLGFYALILDVDDLKRAESALRDNEARLSVIVSQVPAVIWTTDRDLRFTSSEGSGLRHLGLRQNEVVGRTLSEFLQTDDPHDLIIESHRRALAGESMSYASDVGERIFESHVEPLRDHDRGVITGTIGVALDVTDRKQAEAQIRSYQERLRSLASELALAEERERRRIAADLHDRIGQALGLAQIKLEAARDAAGDAPHSEELTECVRLIKQSIQDARTLMFDLSPPILYDLGFEAAAEWLVDQFQGRAGIRISFENDADAKPLGEVLRVILFRASRELLLNVIKHAHAQSASFAVTRENKHIRLEICDDGVGFDPAGVSRTDASGFGLFSIREQLERLGGEMEVQSTPGTGTRIILTGPLDLAAGDQSQGG